MRVASPRSPPRVSVPPGIQAGAAPRPAADPHDEQEDGHHVTLVPVVLHVQRELLHQVGVLVGEEALAERPSVLGSCLYPTQRQPSPPGPGAEELGLVWSWGQGSASRIWDRGSVWIGIWVQPGSGLSLDLKLGLIQEQGSGLVWTWAWGSGATIRAQSGSGTGCQPHHQPAGSPPAPA